MTTERREPGREVAEAEARIWQMYADQIGIPDATSVRPDEAVARQNEPPTKARPQFALRALAITAVVAVVLIGTTVLWSRLLPPSTPPTRTAPIVASEAPTEALTKAQPTPSVRTPTEVAPTVPGPRTRDEVASPPNVAYVPEPTPATRAAPVQPTQQSANARYRVNFEFASDQINVEAKRTLDEIVAAMKANPGWRMLIAGHTDAQGPPEHNKELSKQRALAVKAHLESAGIAPERLSATWFGASRPLASNDSPRRYLNRRVEISGL